MQEISRTHMHAGFLGAFGVGQLGVSDDEYEVCVAPKSSNIQGVGLI